MVATPNGLRFQLQSPPMEPWQCQSASSSPDSVPVGVPIPPLETRAEHLLFGCAKTVSELHLFEPLRLLFERKQIPQIVVNVRIRRKAMEPLEAARLPWAQGVRRSNRPAPTIDSIRLSLPLFPSFFAHCAITLPCFFEEDWATVAKREEAD
jgi:hypothetical protein